MAAASPAALDGNYFHGSNAVLNTANVAAAGSPGAASFTPSAPSPASDVSTPSSTTSSSVPKIAIRPNTAARPTAIKTAGIANSAAMASASTPSPMSATQPLSMTSKNWVVPPRPKPGRKPATDTPPTKRKAQNRAAQRAFRERRAARVGELEEQLEEQKEEHEKTTRELQERIHHLENEVQTLRSRCQWLEKSVEEERQRGDALARNWENSQAPVRSNSLIATDVLSPPGVSVITHPQQSIQPAPRHDAVDTSLRVESRPSAQSISISQIISPPEEETDVLDLTCGNCQSTGPCSCAEELLQDSLQTTTFGCGGCSADTRCACLEESIRASMAADLKRPFPPSSPPREPEGKRHRSDTMVSTMETDFTSLFASTSKDGAPVLPPQSTPQSQPLPSVEPRDSCGFCEDGTYCFCADASQQVAPPPAPQPLAHQIQTPPPSENDVVIPAPMEVTATGAIKLPGVRAMRQGRPAAAASQPPIRNSGGCGPNGPGTCAQCLADPKSGLFCRSLAANINRRQEDDGSGSKSGNNSAGGCCGNGGSGGCCKMGSSSGAAGRENAPATATSYAASKSNGAGSLGLSISCAEAYQTLASHRNFSEAADDIGSWLPKLRAAPIPEYLKNGRATHGHVPGRWAPIEVEAASIMAVLKDFDIRFGRGQ